MNSSARECLYGRWNVGDHKAFYRWPNVISQPQDETLVYAEEETTEESTQDIADKAVSSYTREFLYSLSDSDRGTLVKIDLALERIDEGNFGFCQNCSQPMSEKRLNAVPWASHCVDCQELAEKGLLET